MRIVPRMILILKWDPPSVSPVIQLIQTQTRLLTTMLESYEQNWDNVRLKVKKNLFTQHLNQPTLAAANKTKKLRPLPRWLKRKT